jgi:hypothetical protein
LRQPLILKTVNAEPPAESLKKEVERIGDSLYNSGVKICVIRVLLTRAVFPLIFIVIFVKRLLKSKEVQTSFLAHFRGFYLLL